MKRHSRARYIVVSISLCFFSFAYAEPLFSDISRQGTSYLAVAPQTSMQSQKAPIQTETARMEDRLFPNLPLSFAYSEMGVEISCANLNEAILYYRQYHEMSESRGTGTLSPDNSIFCPYDSTLCMWLEYPDGIKSRAHLFYIKRPSADSRDSYVDQRSLMQVFSPQPGIWKNPPILNVSYPAGTTVYYSLDGSDPQTFGQIYYRPFVIERYGLVNLRLKAVSEIGATEEQTITYSVHATGQVQSDTFYFLTQLPETQTHSFDTITSIETDPQTTKPYQILAWNYLEFLLQMPVVYELSPSPVVPASFPKIAKTYTGPIFVDRTEDIYVYWASESIADGKIQSIFLPAKPKLSISERSSGASQPVHLAFSDARYTYTFTVADKFTASEPSLYSHRFDDNKKTFDIPDNTQFHYNIRIKAFYEQVAHGEYFVDFNINKQKPPALIPQFSTELSSTNEIVTMTLPELPAGASYTPIVRITPQAKQINERTFVLDGITDGSSVYRIIAYYEDADKKRGEVFTHEIEVSPYALYVDTNAQTSGNGTKDAPFTKLERAFAFIKEKKEITKRRWNIFITGNVTLSESFVLSDSLRIIGNDAKITLQTDVGFIIENTDISFSGITFIRNEHELEHRTVPILYASNSTLHLTDVQFQTRYDGTAISLYFSICTMKRVQYTSTQKNYTECFVVSKSELTGEDLDFSLTCDTALAVRLNESLVRFFNTHFSIQCETVCRILELKQAQVELEQVSGERKQSRYNTDTAILVDKDSTLTHTGIVTIEGFKYDIKNAP